MAFCSKCGAQVTEDATFCTGCGAKLNTAPADEAAPQGDAAQNNTQNFANQAASAAKNILNTKDITDTCEPEDIKGNIDRGILAYLGILVLVPIFGGKNSKFARFHANQGLLLLIVDVAYAIVWAILRAILVAVFPIKLNFNATSFSNLATRGAVYSVISFILWIPYLAILALAVIGIVNAARGRAKELPLIGSFKLLK